MKIRQDAWTDENDLLLAETVLRHVREGSTQLNAFEEVGDKLNRTSAACGFRWNAVVRHQYEKALQLAKKQRKQRQRMLGKDQGGKKKLLYSPPVPTMQEVSAAPVQTNAIVPPSPADFYEERTEDEAPVQTETVPSYTYSEPVYTAPAQLDMDTVIAYLQTLNPSGIQVDILKNENERLKRENADLRSQNEELESKIGKLEQNTVTIQEDYETLMKIMNRARNFVLFDEEERPASKFKMDRNGNLERVAE
ncbi:RsfA family transcriptional regulator [Cytobacillus firmus]|uniref:RsfA family transcriptional regulator n=1 Tax=Cytobacillus firmus TaxID=1399 RepID=UPI0018CC8FD9|nr:RsfA family transcriptional regulator [Cytobacillus firmus]MBG9657253.1 Prespore-specific transcriptional regulator RsfA [Cytobacillus firmus]MED1905449.1 RsfA family transcriptional regulator [Cytobacillus firmus]